MFGITLSRDPTLVVDCLPDAISEEVRVLCEPLDDQEASDELVKCEVAAVTAAAAEVEVLVSKYALVECDIICGCDDVVMVVVTEVVRLEDSMLLWVLMTADEVDENAVALVVLVIAKGAVEMVGVAEVEDLEDVEEIIGTEELVVRLILVL